MSADTLEHATGQRRKAVAILLALVPVAIVIALALRTLQGEALRLEALERATAERQHAAFNRELDGELREAALRHWRAVEEILPYPERYRNELRNRVTRGSPMLAVIYDDGVRVYPPSDSVASTPSEVRLFNRLASQISELMRRAYADGEVLRWLYIDGSRALALCRREGAGPLLACVVMGQEETSQVLQSSIERFGSRYAGWLVELADATGERVVGSEPELISAAPEQDRDATVFAMNNIMAGWRASVYQAEDTLSEPRTPSLLTTPYMYWGVSVCAFWLLLVWHFYQRQSAELKRSEERVALAAYLSHDLRTPLANIRLYADLIRREAASNDKIRSFASVIENELDRLESITSTSVALAKEGTAPVPDDDLHPDATIRHLLQLQRPRLAEAGIEAALEGDAERFTLPRSTFERVVGNLLDNACKYAAGGPIEIRTRIVDEELLLVVRDHGPGLDALEGNVESSGLGLQSIRALLAENGGELFLEDAAPGLRVSVRFKPRNEA